MKKITMTLIMMIPVLSLWAQRGNLPDVMVTDLNGQKVSAATLVREGTPALIVFWNSNNGKSVDNLQTLQEAYSENLKGEGVKIISIYSDQNGSWSQVKPIVDGNGWDFETYVDVNGELQRSMNIGNNPCALLLGRDQSVLVRYESDFMGSEEFICKNITSLLENEMTAYHMAPGW